MQRSHGWGRLSFVLVGSLLGGTTAACSAPKPVHRTHQGALSEEDPEVPDDRSHYDEYPFEAAEGWTIRVDMTSDAFDPFLWLLGPNGRALVQDDDGGDGKNARITHVAPSSGTYRVRANSYDASGVGDYRVTIVAGPAGQDSSDE